MKLLLSIPVEGSAVRADAEFVGFTVFYATYLHISICTTSKNVMFFAILSLSSFNELAYLLS